MDLPGVIAATHGREKDAEILKKGGGGGGWKNREINAVTEVAMVERGSNSSLLVVSHRELIIPRGQRDVTVKKSCSFFSFFFSVIVLFRREFISFKMKMALFSVLQILERYQ